MISASVAAVRDVGCDRGRGPAAMLLARVMVGLVVIGLSVIGVDSAPAVAAHPPHGSRIVFRLQDDRIDEASGIGVGVRSKGVVYVENDSGDVNRFFALNSHTGDTAAVVTVPDATNIDWEDLQVAPDAAGMSSVWIADIGDNNADRSEIDVYRVPEPRIDPDAHDVAVTSARPDVWRLRYPDGATDAESLAVTPQGRAYLVTKSFLGVSEVYRLPARPDPSRVRTLSRVSTIDLPATNAKSSLGSIAGVLATSAAVSPNGRLLTVRTYIYADVWRLHPHGTDDGVAAALRTSPTRVLLPRQKQGEGIAFQHDRLLIDSEYSGTPVWSVPLPKTLTAAGTPTSSSASSGPSTTPSSGDATPSRTRPVPASGRRFSGLSFLIIAALLGSVVLLGRRARGFSSHDRQR